MGGGQGRDFPGSWTHTFGSLFSRKPSGNLFHLPCPSPAPTPTPHPCPSFAPSHPGHIPLHAFSTEFGTLPLYPLSFSKTQNQVLFNPTFCNRTAESSSTAVCYRWKLGKTTPESWFLAIFFLTFLPTCAMHNLWNIFSKRQSSFLALCWWNFSFLRYQRL